MNHALPTDLWDWLGLLFTAFVAPPLGFAFFVGISTGAIWPPYRR